MRAPVHFNTMDVPNNLTALAESLLMSNLDDPDTDSTGYRQIKQLTE